MFIKHFNIAILISGGGSNMEAIARYFSLNRFPQVKIALVISDRPDAGGLKKASRLGIKNCYLHPGDYKTKLVGEAEENYIQKLKKEKVDLICLAGFMRIVKAKFISAFPRKIINIHPSLLPKYPGLNTHARALAAGEKEAGCTIHLVDLGIDTGPIIRQRKVVITQEDTKDSLNEKVIAEEHLLYPEVIADIFKKKINLQDL